MQTTKVGFQEGWGQLYQQFEVGVPTRGYCPSSFMHRANNNPFEQPDGPRIGFVLLLSPTRSLPKRRVAKIPSSNGEIEAARVLGDTATKQKCSTDHRGSLCRSMELQ
jgi:hypothetical protein